MLLQDFYSVIQSKKEENFYSTQIKIDKDHIIYKGHFPERPVTPGVILMQLFREEAERQLNVKLQLAKAQNVKFTTVVDPNKNPNLLLEFEISKENNQVKLKGSAKQKDCIALKISALYSIKSNSSS